MKPAHPHRLWIGLLALAATIALLNRPFIDGADGEARQRLDSLRRARIADQAALKQLQDDIAATRQLKTEIAEGEAEAMLAPVDRQQAARDLERCAAENRLSDFAYTLAPETEKLFETVAAGPQKMALSPLRITAFAPADTDAYLFLDEVGRTLPGRIAWTRLSLERLDAPLGAANIRLIAEGTWLSNGAALDLSHPPVDPTP